MLTVLLRIVRDSFLLILFVSINRSMCERVCVCEMGKLYLVCPATNMWNNNARLLLSFAALQGLAGTACEQMCFKSLLLFTSDRLELKKMSPVLIYSFGQWIYAEIVGGKKKEKPGYFLHGQMGRFIIHEANALFLLLYISFLFSHPAFFPLLPPLPSACRCTEFSQAKVGS